jgi:glycosyltransferase involved in cell wall biosynthesis
MEPFVEFERPAIVHVRTNAFSNRSAPFIRQTVLGLRPYFHNIVICPKTDCENPPDVSMEFFQGFPAGNRNTWRLAAKYLRKKYFNIQLVMGHMGNGTRCAKLLAGDLKVPLLGSFGGSDLNVEFEQREYRAAHKSLLATPCAHFVTVAEYLRQKLLDYGARPEQVFTWHRGVDLDRFHTVDRRQQRGRSSKMRLLMSSRFYEVKGHEYAIRAVAKLLSQGAPVELLLLGEGPMQGKLEALTAELGVNQSVRFEGQVTHEQVARYMEQSDIYIHPSIRCREGRMEGAPNAIMEAHAVGLPVVATDLGGVPEIVLDGKTGLLVPPENADQLAAGIGRLLGPDGEELRKRMGVAGREHVERRFNSAVQSRRLAGRILQLIHAGCLFDQRGWPKHIPLNDSQTAANGRCLMDALGTTSKSKWMLSRRRFRILMRLLRMIKATHRWLLRALVFRPYYGFDSRRAIDMAWHRIHDLNAAKHAGQGLTGEPAGPLSMSQAVCIACPHCKGESTWPARPCPMDLGCLRALSREFTPDMTPPECTLTPAPGGGRRGLVLCDADLPSDGRLPQKDSSLDRVCLKGHLQAVRDHKALFREFRRILTVGGELTVQIWPLAGGRDGARLLGEIHVPFAQHFFAREVLESFTGQAFQEPKAFGPEDLHSWAAQAGLTLDQEQSAGIYMNPCEMHVQARFAPIFRNMGLSISEIARFYYARYRMPVQAKQTMGEYLTCSNELPLEHRPAGEDRVR